MKPIHFLAACVVSCFLFTGCTEPSETSEDVQSETTSSIPPETPVLINPTDRSEFNIFPRDMVFEWEAHPDESVLYHFEVEYSWNQSDAFGIWGPGNSRNLVREMVQGNTYRLTFVGAQPGRWRVKAENQAGASGWSAWSYFRHRR
ncbi:MAG: hypothetical protein AAGI38_03435 [Bacteroidota bacterium]